MEQFLSKIKDIRSEVDKALANYPLPEFPASLYEPVKYSLVSGGKKFRPALVILCGEAFGVKRTELMPAALAVEILHTFSLVHDDIMDGDSQRRGKPTVHVKWDENTAILSGDTLMSMAFNSLMQTKTDQSARIGLEFSQAMIEICEGQALDTEFESRMDVTTDEYLTMIRKKTGRLLALSCQLGALIAGCDDAVVENLYNFGIEIGLAFQIQDDLLEIMSDESKMGKSLGSDFALGKKNFSAD